MTSIVALVIESVTQILSPENRDQGSIFSHEIRASEAAGVIATILGSHLNNYSSSPLSASG